MVFMQFTEVKNPRQSLDPSVSALWRYQTRFYEIQPTRKIFSSERQQQQRCSRYNLFHLGSIHDSEPHPLAEKDDCGVCCHLTLTA